MNEQDFIGGLGKKINPEIIKEEVKVSPQGILHGYFMYPYTHCIL